MPYIREKKIVKISKLRIAELSLGTMRASKNYDDSLLDTLGGLVEHSRDQDKKIADLETKLEYRTTELRRLIDGIDSFLETYHPQ